MRSTNRTSFARKLAAAALAIAAGVTGYMPGGGREAQAIIGRPLTPLSFAGVARRTARRSVAYGAYGAYGVYGGAVAGAATAAAIMSLPAGCVKTYANGVPVYACGTVAYRPVYQGPDLVYVPVAVP